MLGNQLFLGILGVEAILQVGLRGDRARLLCGRCGADGSRRAAQVAIVQLGGDAFATRPLSAAQWGACVGIGALSLIVRAVLVQLPPKPSQKPG